MRNLKFILSAITILLVGAIASGLAAQSVVAPRTGEVRSAGVLTIPTALGQTAEEVLFYPWSMYDTEAIYDIPDENLLYIFDLEAYGVTLEDIRENLANIDLSATDNTFVSLLSNFTLIQPVHMPWGDLFSALEWNYPPQGHLPTNGHIFLKDLPTVIIDETKQAQIPVTLSFAIGDSAPLSVSFLIRPAEARTLTEEEQASALERVETDLRQLLLFNHVPIAESPADSDVEYDPEADVIVTEMEALLKTFFDYNYNAELSFSSILLHINDFFDSRAYFVEAAGSSVDDLYQVPMDEFLSTVEANIGWNIQVITTQQQIVVLFTQAGNVFGIYYDIQLGCYSGIGISR